MEAEGVHLVISGDVVDGRAIRVGVGRVLHHHVHENVDPIQGHLQRLRVCKSPRRPRLGVVAGRAPSTHGVAADKGPSRYLHYRRRQPTGLSFVSLSVTTKVNMRPSGVNGPPFG